MIVKVLCRFPIGDLRFATRNLQDNQGNWQNKIIAISSLSRNIGEDKSYEISGMDIEFNDVDRFFRNMMSGAYRYIAGKTVEFMTEDDILIYIGTVEKWAFGPESFKLFINDRLSGLDKVIPPTITKDMYPNLVEAAEGGSISIIFGYVQDSGGAVKCFRVDNDTYLLADHHCHSFIGGFLEDGTDISSACALDNNADGRAYIQYSGGVDFVFVNVMGAMNQSSDLIEEPAEALAYLLDNYSELSYSQTALNDAGNIMTDRGYQIIGVINNQQTLKEVLIYFAFSFDCDFHIDKGNEIIVTLLDWGRLIPQKKIIEKQVIDFQLQELPEEIRNKVKFLHKYNFALQEFRKAPEYKKEESIETWGEFYNKNEALDLRYVSGDDTAFDVVQRFVIQRKNPRRIVQVDLPLEEAADLDIADIIEIQHSGAITEQERKYQVRRIDIEFIHDTLQIEGVDVTTLTGGIFILADDTFAENWEEADDYERQFSYLCGTDGLFPDGEEGKILY